jgi:hypothetical protein
MRYVKLTLAIVFSFVFLIWAGARIVADINFGRNCEGYLKRAADANTIGLAIENIEVAIKYAENNNLKSGYTSIVFRTPDEDIGFWYTNLTASLMELRAVGSETSRLERTNILMKLRETILDQGQSTSVTIPSGISIYPSNGFYAMWAWFSFILAVVFWILFIADIVRQDDY